MTLRLLLVLLFLITPTSSSAEEVAISDFDNIQLFTFQNKNGLKIKVTNYGAIITSICVPDRHGKLADIALGYDDVADYMNAVEKPYFGAVVGRFGNRIANGQFTLNGETYRLAQNNGPHHLHGGIIGFDKVVWDAKPIAELDWRGVELHYRAKDMEEGYPGNLEVTVTYKLFDDNRLSAEFAATTDKATPVNLTQHTYFNLQGEGEGTILGHELMLNASRYNPTDNTSIPNGELADVTGTPFDFRKAKPIGQDIEQSHEQLEFGAGYDHNFVLDKEDGELSLAARVYEPNSGRVMEVHTQEPGIQFYCGNFLSGRLKGKSGQAYVQRGGFCLETQHFPDSPNQPNFPSTILKPGDEYRTKTVFAFSTR